MEVVPVILENVLLEVIFELKINKQNELLYMSMVVHLIY